MYNNNKKNNTTWLIQDEWIFFHGSIKSSERSVKKVRKMLGAYRESLNLNGDYDTNHDLS
jgi:hypothetical protein